MATDKNGNYIKGTKKDLPDGWVTYGFQFALVPNDLDKQRLERAFGCARKVYNEYVAGLYDDLKSIDFNGLYVDSEAKKAGYPHDHKVIEQRQRRLNKSLARKKNHASTDEEGHVIFLNNYKKEVKKYQKTMVKAKHQRKDFLHKRSDQITNDIDNCG